MDQFIRNIVVPGGVWYRKSNFLKKRPGTTFQYSNLGAAVAAYVLERVTGDSFAEYTERYIFKPIGMSHSGWSFDGIDIDRHVTQYVSRMKIVPRYSLITYPDGGLITSVEDLSRYLMEMMKGYQGESRLLRQDSFREIMSPSGSKPGTGGYNMFWTLRTDGSIGHGGGDPGITTSMFFHPAKNIGAIVFTNYTFVNSNKDPAGRQFQDVANALLADDAAPPN
jgi:CubicO group peptidase (beta-lactamase class C family)